MTSPLTPDSLRKLCRALELDMQGEAADALRQAAARIEELENLNLHDWRELSRCADLACVAARKRVAELEADCARKDKILHNLYISGDQSNNGIAAVSAREWREVAAILKDQRDAIESRLAAAEAVCEAAARQFISSPGCSLEDLHAALSAWRSLKDGKGEDEA